MQILSKLTAATVLAGSAAVSAQGVYVSPGTAYFAPGTFGQTFSDGSYVSAGVAAKPGEYNDISYASQNGGPAANTGYNYQGGYQGGFQGGFNPGFQGGYQGGYQGGFDPSSQYGPAPGPAPYSPPVAVGGQQNFQPPPPPVYVGGTNAPSDSNGPPPLVTVGQAVHTGGFKTKRDVATKQQFPYGGWGGYGYRGYGGYGSYGLSNYYNNWYSGPTVTVGAPTAYFAPGTFGQTFSDGSYVSAGVPRPFKKLNKRQVTVLGSPYGGPTVTVGAPTAYFAPGTFGQTWSDGSYTSWGVPQIPSYPSYYKRE